MPAKKKDDVPKPKPEKPEPAKPKEEPKRPPEAGRESAVMGMQRAVGNEATRELLKAATPWIPQRAEAKADLSKKACRWLEQFASEKDFLEGVKVVPGIGDELKHVLYEIHTKGLSPIPSEKENRAVQAINEHVGG